MRRWSTTPTSTRQETRKLERRLGRQYHLITREDRLERIAADLVQHFAGRGYRGKAMFIAIDKATAVRMYDKVRAHWSAEMARREAALAALNDEAREVAEAELAWMRETDMAVIVSQGQNEIDDMARQGLDIRPHRERMVREKMDEKFKDGGRSVPPRFRLRDVDHRLRRADLLDHLPRQADEEPHA